MAGSVKPGLMALGVPEVDWESFLRSPGFGGTAAVVAAPIAFWAAARSRRAENERAREARWWEQARWGGGADPHYRPGR